MNILFSTGCLFYLPLRDVFYLASDAGFDGCDLVIDSRFDNPRYLEEATKCADILPVRSIHAPYLKLRTWGTKSEALSRTLEIGRGLGAGIINFHPPSWFSLELQFLQWFRKVKDFQEELRCGDLFVTLENMPLSGKRLMLASYMLNDFRDLIEFGVQRNLHFTFDTTHLATFGEDVVAAFLVFRDTGRLKNIHISDYGGFKSHLALGRGNLPVAKLLNTMRRLHYDGCVTLEISPNELPKAPVWLLKIMRHQQSLLRFHLSEV